MTIPLIESDLALIVQELDAVLDGVETGFIGDEDQKRICVRRFRKLLDLRNRVGSRIAKPLRQEPQSMREIVSYPREIVSYPPPILV